MRTNMEETIYARDARNERARNKRRMRREIHDARLAHGVLCGRLACRACYPAPALHENDVIEYLGGIDPRDGGR